MSEDRQQRAEGRRDWPGGLVRRQQPAQLDSPAERLASMWQLALDAWALRGEELPDYERADMPGELIRP